MHNTPDIDFKPIFAKRANDAAAACNHADRVKCEAMYAAVKQVFPHVRHDELFQNALYREMDRMRANIKRASLSWVACAYDIENRLTGRGWQKEGDKIPPTMRVLHQLYPAYKQMAAEANTDYNRLSMKLFARAADIINDATLLSVSKPTTKWGKCPDYWAERVKASRATAGIQVAESSAAR